MSQVPGRSAQGFLTLRIRTVLPTKAGPLPITLSQAETVLWSVTIQTLTTHLCDNVKVPLLILLIFFFSRAHKFCFPVWMLFIYHCRSLKISQSSLSAPTKAQYERELPQAERTNGSFSGKAVGLQVVPAFLMGMGVGHGAGNAPQGPLLCLL